jgi:hypothetical protein
VVSRQQLLELGYSQSQAQQNVANGRWRSLLPGVYATFTGPVEPMALVWAAVLYAGDGAAASHSTALWLAGVLVDLPRPLHISVGHTRRVRSQRGLLIHRASALDLRPHTLLHPAARPPRFRTELSLLDQAASGSDDFAIDLVLKAIQRRQTTSSRIRSTLASMPRHRWRKLLLEVLDEAAQGVASPLELRYLRQVERPHGLPAARRNLQERNPSGGNWYRDVRYPAWCTVVELDGLEAHPTELAFRDFRRDNLAATSGDTVLRYGWRDVVGNPCGVAAQVASILRLRGWNGVLKPCGQRCAAQAGN